MDEGVGMPQIIQKTIAQTLALVSTRYQTGNI